MRVIYTSLILISVLFTCVLVSCSPKQDAAIREKTNLGLGDMVKAKDRGLEGNVRTTLASNPIFKWYGLDCTVSHDVITLIGTVRTEEEKQEAFELVASIELERVKRENIINDIKVDPSIEPPPFEW